MKLLIAAWLIVAALSAFFLASEGRSKSLLDTSTSDNNFNRHIGKHFARKLVIQHLLKGGAICNECQEVVEELHSVISNPQVEKEVQDLLDQDICPMLGQYKQMCSDFVDAELPAIFVELEAVLANAKNACQEFGFCSSSAAVQNLFINKKHQHRMSNKNNVVMVQNLRRARRHPVPVQWKPAAYKLVNNDDNSDSREEMDF